MKIYADVLTADGQTNANVAGYILLTNLQYTRELDDLGGFSLTAPVADSRVTEFLTNERRLRFLAIEDFPESVAGSLDRSPNLRVIGYGIIRQVSINETAASKTLRAQGVGLLDELRRYNTLLNRVYDEVAASDVLFELAQLAGWYAETPVTSNPISIRFDGASAIKAFKTVTYSQGVHFRETDQLRHVEVGAFGESSGVVLLKAPAVPHQSYSVDNIGLIDGINQMTDTESLINRVYPIGGGEGEAKITLLDSDRTGYYEIRTTTGADGLPIAYLQDDDSVAAYGVFEEVVAFKEAQPTGNSAAAITSAGNFVYDNASAYLRRACVPRVEYNITCRRLRTSVQVGDKIRVTFSGQIYDRHNKPLTYLSVDREFWVLAVAERYDVGGTQFVFTVSTVDRLETNDESDQLVAAVSEIKQRNTVPAPYPFVYTYSAERPVQRAGTGHNGQVISAIDATFEHEFGLGLMARILSVKLRIRTKPITSRGTTTADPAAVVRFNQTMLEGDIYPKNLQIAIDGTDRTTALGGEWNSGGAETTIDETLDITDYVNTLANHTLTFSVGNDYTGDIAFPTYTAVTGTDAFNLGLVEITLYVFGITQAVL